jgi:AraC family transcriptional regulator
MSQPISEAGGSFGRVSLVDVDRPVAAHAHPQCHALFKLAGTDSVFEIEGRRYPLAEGVAVLVNAWQPHSYPMPAGTQVLALYIEPAWLTRFDASFAAAARRDFFLSPAIAVPAATSQLVFALAEELRGMRSEPQRALRLLELLMTDLAVRFSRYRSFPAWARSATAAVADRRIRKAMALIAERAGATCDMARIAQEAALSRAHFFELFHRSLGITPAAYRNVVRMERAYRALLESETPVGDIGRGLGFSVHAHFTRFFRDNHGVAPEAYRHVAWRVEA